MEDYSSVSIMIKLNYFIVFAFSVVVIVCNYERVNIKVYVFFKHHF